MTVLGKILVFFVLFLSLVWAALTVNAFVTRTNWKTALDATAKKLDEAAASARGQQEYAKAQKEAADVALAQRDEQVRQLAQRAAALQSDLTAAQQTLAAAKAAQADQDAPTRALQNEIAKLQNQVTLLQNSQLALEKAVNDATIAMQKARDEELQAKIDRDAALRRAERLEDQVVNARDRQAGGVGARVPQVDANFRATVTTVSGDQVEINQGFNAGLQRGARVSVSRLQPQPKYVGDLEITHVDAFTAVGRFIPRAGVRSPSGDDLPRKGDTVSVIR